MTNCNAPESLQEFQQTFGQYLRDPKHIKRPPGIPARRAKVYEALLFNNLCGFLDACFPVCKSLLKLKPWRRLCRVFYRDWRCKTPFFSGIPGEFLQFLQSGLSKQRLPAWFLELAHYEWVELAVDTAADEEAEEGTAHSQAEGLLAINPSARNLFYHWPVHRICPDYRPRKPQNVFLVVYRNRQHKVVFVELNPATSLLLTLIQQNPGTRAAVLSQLAGQMATATPHANLEALQHFGGQMIDSLISQEILFES